MYFKVPESIEAKDYFTTKIATSLIQETAGREFHQQMKTNFKTEEVIIHETGTIMTTTNLGEIVSSTIETMMTMIVFLNLANIQGA